MYSLYTILIRLYIIVLMISFRFVLNPLFASKDFLLSFSYLEDSCLNEICSERSHGSTNIYGCMAIWLQINKMNVRLEINLCCFEELYFLSHIKYALVSISHTCFIPITLAICEIWWEVLLLLFKQRHQHMFYVALKKKKNCSETFSPVQTARLCSHGLPVSDVDSL